MKDWRNTSLTTREMENIIRVIEDDMLYLNPSFKLTTFLKQFKICRAEFDYYFYSENDISFCEYIDCLRVMYARKLLLTASICGEKSWKKSGFKSHKSLRSAINRIIF